MIAAIQALKKKKRFEKQLQQIDGTLSTIEMQREALEGANTNTAVLTTMKNAADALKEAHKHMYVSNRIIISHESNFVIYFNLFALSICLRTGMLIKFMI